MRPARVLNFILICAHSTILIAEACVSFKAANRESFPYIMHIVDEPRKFSPSNVLTYTVIHVYWIFAILQINVSWYWIYCYTSSFKVTAIIYAQ